MYDEKGLRYLAGLAAQKKVHRQLLASTTEAELSRAETQCRKSKVGRFVTAEAKQEGERIVLSWQVKVNQLTETMQQDGRYLIVTNDPTLSPTRMFELYRAKDGVEKDFRICKSQLKVSPLYLHKDERFQSMLPLNMLALLAYIVLERQARQSGLALTTRRIMEQLDTLTVIETHCVDGSRFYRLTPVSQAQAELIEALRLIFPAAPEPLPLPVAASSAPVPTPTGQLTLAAFL